MKTTTSLIGCWFALATLSAAAHETPMQLAQLGGKELTSVPTTMAGHQVKITVSGGERVITANGLPDHAPGQFPNRGNPNRIAEQNYNFRIPTKPQTNAARRDGRGAWFWGCAQRCAV